MSDSGWITHKDYGTVYQPDVAGARTAVHAQYDAWYGEECDTLTDCLDLVQYAAMRSVLTNLVAIATAGGKPALISVEEIRAMLRVLDAQQHGEKAGG